MGMSQKLVFHQIKCVFEPSSIYSLLRPCMYPRLSSCICVFHVTVLRCMLKFKRLACGSDDVTQYKTVRIKGF